MARKFYTPIDLNQNQLYNGALQNLASAPSSPVAGQIYFDTTQNRPFVWNAVGTAWQWYATNSDQLNGQSASYYLARGNATGTQAASTISNLQSTVISYTLDTFAQPQATMNFNGQRLSNIGTPSAATDAATKSYVDTTVQGLSPKPSAMVASTAALPTNAYANGALGVGATLTATANGVLTIDTYSPVVGDLILVKNEASSANNGLYTLTTAGTLSVAYILTRHVDMDQSNEFGGGFIAVKNAGSANANSLWLCECSSSITVGSTAVSFTELNGATQLTQGNGISISGNQISAAVVAGGGVLCVSGGLEVDTTVVARKYATAFGDGASFVYTITHNLGTEDVTVEVYATASPFAEIDVDVNHATTNTITLTFSSANAAPTLNQFRVVVLG
jgi:hypothetical protein